MTRRLVTAGVASLALLALASCTSPSPHAAGHRTRSPQVAAGRIAAIRRTMNCNRRLPPSNAPLGTAPTPDIRRGPVVAVICEYEYKDRYGPGPSHLAGQLTLGVRAADGLVAVLDGATPVQPSFTSCGVDTQSSHSEDVLLGYLTGPVTSVIVTVPACQGPTVVSADGRSFGLSWPVIRALLYSAADASGNRGPRAPELTGLSLAAAATAARRHGLALQLSAVVTDPGHPFGSVLYQALPAGTRSRLRNGPSVGVIVAIGPAPPCTPGQLRLTYRGNGAIRGQDWGAVVISDIGTEPCRLPGSAWITGLDRAGRPVTKAHATKATAPIILSPHTAPIQDGVAAPYGIPPPPGDLAGAITLFDGFRLVPYSIAGTLCRPNWVIPAAWLVAIGGLSATVPNTDPRGPTPIVPSGAFVTCEGKLFPGLTYYGLIPG